MKVMTLIIERGEKEEEEEEEGEEKECHAESTKLYIPVALCAVTLVMNANKVTENITATSAVCVYVRCTDVCVCERKEELKQNIYYIQSIINTILSVSNKLLYCMHYARLLLFSEHVLQTTLSTLVSNQFVLCFAVIIISCYTLSGCTLNPSGKKN